MNIIEAIKSPLIRPFLEDANGSIASWSNWLTVWRCVFGLPVPKYKHDLIKQCTGRSFSSIPAGGMSELLLLTGRRSGKSRQVSVAGFVLSALLGNEKKLAKGEKGMVAICSPTKKQSRIIKNYLRAIFDNPLMEGEVIGETKEGFELSNGVLIELMAGDFRSVRGYTLLAALVDEVCFMGVDEDAKVKSDTELIRALRPALATVPGAKLIALSTCYMKAGWAWKTYEREWGNPKGRVLVWNGPSTLMNPTLPQSVVDAARDTDYQLYLSEFMGCWREPLDALFSRSQLDSLVVKDRIDAFPRKGVRYHCFVDMSGGRVDSATICITSRDKESKKVRIEFLKEYKPPFSPTYVIGRMVEILREWGIKSVTGDRFGSRFTSDSFSDRGIHYQPSDKSASELFLELLPVVSTGGIELPPDEVMLHQLSTLERRVRSGGKDLVEARKGLHDDVAVAVAGACYLANQKFMRVGAF
jgi:hypothetical protein